MGVFETLASVCEPADLASIRDGMRRFLSAAGADARGNRKLLRDIAEEMLPLERAYLPTLNHAIVNGITSKHLVAFAHAEGRQVVLVAAVLRPTRILLIDPGIPPDMLANQKQRLVEGGAEVSVIGVRSDSIQKDKDRVLERLRREHALDNCVLYPGEGPPNLSVALTAAAQQRGIPVVYAELESYAGVERPFSLRLHAFGEPTSDPKDEHESTRGQNTASQASAADESSSPRRFAPAAESPWATPATRTERPISPPSLAPRTPTTPPQTQPPFQTPTVPPAAQPQLQTPASPPAAQPQFRAATTPIVPPPPAAQASVPATEVAKLFVSSFNGRNYAAAKRLAWHIARFSDVMTLMWVTPDVLDELVRVYADWDRFAHSPMTDNPDRRLHDRLVSVWQRLGPARGKLVSDSEISSNAAFLRSLQGSWKPGGHIHGDAARVVDFFAAGTRRRGRGRNTAAAWSLLRSMDLAAILLLREPPFAIGDPFEPDYTTMIKTFGNYNDIAERANRVLRSAGRKETMPPREAPLNRDAMMALLEVGGEQWRIGPALAIGSRYRETMTRVHDDGESERSLRDALDASLLAPGTSALGPDVTERLEKATSEIVSRALGVDKFRKLLKAATHPTMKIPALEI